MSTNFRDFSGNTLSLPSSGNDSPNPFDPEKLRLPAESLSNIKVKTVLQTIPAHKPSRQAFIRTHHDPNYRITAAMLELKETREHYIVAPEVYQILRTETTVEPRILITTITRQGSLFLWPLRLPKSSMKTDKWAESALAAADMAQRHWVRVTANMKAGAYDIEQASGNLPEPTWPEMTFQEILNAAFKGMVINNVNHPVLRQLRGEE